MLCQTIAYGSVAVALRLLTSNPVLILRCGYAMVPFCGMILISEFLLSSVQLGAREIISQRWCYLHPVRQYDREGREIVMYVAPDCQPLLRLVSFHTRVMMLLYLTCIGVELADVGCPDTWITIAGMLVTLGYEWGVHSVDAKSTVLRFVAVLVLNSTIIGGKNVCYAGHHYLVLLRVTSVNVAVVHFFTVSLPATVHWWSRFCLRCVLLVVLCGAWYVALVLMQTLQEGLVGVAVSFVSADAEVLARADGIDINEWYVREFGVSQNVAAFIRTLRVTSVKK